MNHLQSDFPEHDAPIDERFQSAAKFAQTHSVQDAEDVIWRHPLPFGMNAPFFQAGLAGYSDAAMRVVARRHGCPLCVTEAMLDHFLIQGGKGLNAARLWEEDHPITGQLMGSHPDEIAQGAKILVDLNYDIIDVNLACPVKKVKKKARGGHMLKEPEAARDILQAVREVVPGDIPTSLKLRRGSDDTPEAEARFFEIYDAAMDLGYAVITVHGRTVEQKYLGPSRWSFLKKLSEYTRERKARLGIADDAFFLFGSGDIWDAADIFAMIERTGVDGVSVARGCIGNPWIFHQARSLMRGDHETALEGPSITEQKNVLLAHFHDSVKLHGERQASRMMRKFGIRFAQHHPDSEAVRQAFIEVNSSGEWESVLDRLYAENSESQTTRSNTAQLSPAVELDSCEAE